MGRSGAPFCVCCSKRGARSGGAEPRRAPGPCPPVPSQIRPPPGSGTRYRARPWAGASGGKGLLRGTGSLSRHPGWDLGLEPTSRSWKPERKGCAGEPGRGDPCYPPALPFSPANREQPRTPLAQGGTPLPGTLGAGWRAARRCRRVNPPLYFSFHGSALRAGTFRRAKQTKINLERKKNKNTSRKETSAFRGNFQNSIQPPPSAETGLITRGKNNYTGEKYYYYI